MITFIHSTYFKNLLNGFSVGALIMNIHGDVYAANLVAAELFGQAETEALLGQGLRQRLAAGLEGHADLARLMEEACAGRHPAEPQRVVYRHPSRGLLHLNVSISLLNEAGKIFGILMELNDVTEIIRLHEQEKRGLQESQRLQAERIEGLSKFANAVAHQIRNPAMTIGGMANLLLKRRGPEDGERRYLEGILDGTRRLAAIVEAVQEYTRPLKLKVCPVMSLPLLNAVRCKAQARAKGLGVRAEIVLQAQDLALLADAGALEGVLCELAANALASLPAQGGQVVLSCRADGQRALLGVQDDGGGIEPETLPYVFDPFFTTKAVGVGMGLSSARRTIAFMGGELALAARRPAGTLAQVWLPLAEQAACLLQV